MKVDLLAAEIGSTTTLVNAFTALKEEEPRFLGQGMAPTTVLEGDVTLGLRAALENLQENLGCPRLDYQEMVATSSAAGGLKMTVHGLVHDMTVKAAKEAALGAGANIHMVTSGLLRKGDLEAIQEIGPNIILLAGGVDHGERETALVNAQLIADLPLNTPVIYAGNSDNRREVEGIFKAAGKGSSLRITENVYPRIDQLQVEPARKIIQQVFEEHIIHAPGMERVRKMVHGPLLPTPGAVMAASQLLEPELGPLLTIDVGGATTDVHSVCDDTPGVSKDLLAPEPRAKRSVEGDLGVFVNRKNLIRMVGPEKLAQALRMEEEEFRNLGEALPPVPREEKEYQLLERLTEKAVIESVHRHGGRYRFLYGPGGKKGYAEGKDLTGIENIIGTGGALTNLPGGQGILQKIAGSNRGDQLLPTKEARVFLDRPYLMASLGILSLVHREAALKLLLKSIG